MSSDRAIAEARASVLAAERWVAETKREIEQATCSKWKAGLRGQLREESGLLREFRAELKHLLREQQIAESLFPPE